MEVSASTNGTWATMPANASGAMVDHRAHQQPARRAAPRDQPAGRRPALIDQVPGTGHEVGERVGLVQHLAVVVPAAAHLAAAADMRDRVHEAPVEQRQPGDGKPRIHGDLVAAVAVEQARRAAVPRRAAPADQRDRNAGAVGGGRPLAALLVVRRVVCGRRCPAAPAPAGAAQGQLAGAGVAVVDRVRGDQRGVVQPELRARCTPGFAARGDRCRRVRGRRLVLHCRRPGGSAARSGRRGGSRRPRWLGERVHVQQPGARRVRR